MNILDNYYILNEDTAPDGASNELRQAFENSMRETFLQNKKRDNIAVDISLPTSFNKPIRFPAAPMDLRNLLKPKKFKEKFVNGNGMMADPVSTFNHATDVARQCFENANQFEKALSKEKEPKFGNDKGKLDRGHSKDFGIPKDASTSESLYYFNNDTYNFINEGAISTGATVGAAVGKIVSKIAFATISAGASFIVTTLPLSLFCYSAGYFGELIAGNVKGRNYPMEITNTEEVIKSNLQTTTSESDASWQGENVIEAVDDYLIDIANDIDSIVGFLNPDSDHKLVSEIESYINSNNTQVEEYLKNNSGLIKQIRQENDEYRRKQYERINAKNRDVAAFAQNMSRVNGINTPNDIKIFSRLATIYNTAINKNTPEAQDIVAELDNAVDGKNWSDVLAVVKAHPKFFKSALEESINEEEYRHALNEGEAVQERPSVDGNELYNNYLEKFRALAREEWPKKIQRIEECQTIMNKLQEDANTEIKDKIQIVCRMTNDGSNTTSDKIKAFFSKHPMQAGALNTLWGRHSAELEIRKGNRLRQMQNFSDRTRIMGWFAYLFKNTMPEVLARMFTYRHVLMMLKAANVYTYTPESFKEDEKQWEEHKEEYMDNINLMLSMYFKTMGGNWTITGKTFIEASENGGYDINLSNFPSYLTFLIINCGNNDGSSIGSASMNKLAPIVLNLIEFMYKNSIDADHFVGYFIGIIQGDSDDVISKILNEKIKDLDQVINRFSNTKLLNAVKETIDSTYNSLNGGQLVVNIKNTEASYANYILQKGGKELFSKIKENLSKLKDIVKSVNEDTPVDELKSIKNQIKKLIGELPEVDDEELNLFDYESVFKKIHETDRWAYIYNMYEALNISTVTEYLGAGIYEQSIKDICDTIITYVDILGSGILTVGMNIDEGSILLGKLRESYKNIEDKESLNNFASLVYSEEAIIQYNTEIENLDDKNIEKIIDLIQKSIKTPDNDLLEYNDYKTTYPELVKLNAEDGVENINTLNDLLNSENGKITNIENFVKVQNALAAIINYAIEKAGAFTAETLKEFLKNAGFDSLHGTPQQYIAYWYDNYRVANDYINTAPDDDILSESLQQLVILDMPTILIKTFNVNNKEISLLENTEIWDLFRELISTSDPNGLCAAIENISFGGKTLKEQDDKKYQIVTNLFAGIKNAIDSAQKWKEFEDAIK